VTDSVAQVPAEVARELDISVIPFTVSIDRQPYLDGIDLAPHELYRRMRLENIMPTTAAPSLGQYLQAFEACLRAGAQTVLYVALSSKLSSGYSTACHAAKMVQEEFPDRIVEVMDSQLATISQGFVAMTAARAAKQGKPLAEVKQVAEDAEQRVGFAATLETLEYLARGGRIGKAAFMLGNLIKIKPILTLQEGEVTPVSRARGENHALQAIVDYVRLPGPGPVYHGSGCPGTGCTPGGISLAKIAADTNLPHGIHARDGRSYRTGIGWIGLLL